MSIFLKDYIGNQGKNTVFTVDIRAHTQKWNLPKINKNFNFLGDSLRINTGNRSKTLV